MSNPQAQTVLYEGLKVTFPNLHSVLAKRRAVENGGSKVENEVNLVEFSKACHDFLCMREKRPRHPDGRVLSYPDHLSAEDLHTHYHDDALGEVYIWLCRTHGDKPVIAALGENAGIVSKWAARVACFNFETRSKPRPPPSLISQFSNPSSAEFIKENASALRATMTASSNGTENTSVSKSYDPTLPESIAAAYSSVKDLYFALENVMPEGTGIAPSTQGSQN